MAGTLYIVGTPIGNLEDITFRALRVLMEADVILCEDTRVTKKLLDHFNIRKPLLSYHQHSGLRRVEEVVGRLRRGENAALVSDAGTPGIQDPAGKLVIEVLAQLKEGARIVPIPGVSALTTLASVSGTQTDRFLFLGFLPAKKGREKLFKEMQVTKYPVFFYESTHRIAKTLSGIAELMPSRQVVVGRELTKAFESIYRGTAAEILAQLERGSTRGEFVVIVS